MALEIVAYLASVLIGISLGLIGGGGSILTVPVLVYLFKVDMITATAYSLFIVGISSAVGSISYFKKGLINMKTAVVFGVPSIVAVYLTRAFVIPAIPEHIMTIGHFELNRSALLLILFAILMVLASYSMIKKNKSTGQVEEEKEEQKFNYPLILIEGLVVGGLTGLVGAGGGFLIIPALVVLSKLPMKMAVGTSLLIIAAKSLIGFMGESGESQIEWSFLISVSAVAIIGIFIGFALSKKISGERLKPAFGWFVLIMGLYILLKEIFLA